MTPFTTLTSRTVRVAAREHRHRPDHPARFLTTTSREGLGTLAFYDWRYDATAKRMAIRF